MEPLGSHKPFELLAAILELCPRGHETSIFFTHLFLERLPTELRNMLGEDDHQNPRDVTKKADSLWLLHRMHLSPAHIASVEGTSSVDRSSPPSVAVSKRPASCRPPNLIILWSLPGFSMGFAITISTLESRPITAQPPETGETSLLGVSQRSSSWPTGSRGGRSANR
jgi:hypothetical protein